MAVEATHPNQSVRFPWPNINPHFQQISFSGINSLENVQRKRSIEFINQMNTNVDCSQFSSSFFGETNLVPQIQQYQLEIDSILSQHTKKMRLDLQEKQKQHAKLMMTAIEEKAIQKLKEKDEQILKMGKLNWALQERVKCLLMENQLWRGLAQTNQAQAQSLRADLEQALAHIKSQERLAGDDVESCCGSTGNDVAGCGWTCKRCGEKESSVVVLPCQHLCLCNVCGSGAYHVQVCPVCNCDMSGTLHVNMSP